MPRYDANSAECLVFTFKDGLLSPVAHDLQLRVTSFTIEIDDARSAVHASFDAKSLKVVTAMKHGAPNPGALSDKDREEIQRSIVDEVLEAAAQPTIEFASEAIEQHDSGWRVAGVLALHGTRKHLAIPVREEGGRLVGEVTIHQPDFGIRPYKAMMGTLKIKPDVIVRVSVPAT